MNKLIFAVAVLALLPLAATSQDPPPKDPPQDKPEEKASEIPKVLLDPSLPEWKVKAPAAFKAKFTTSKGDFVVEVERAWAPQGADRFYCLVKNGYYDDVRFFRVISGFMAQFGIHGKPEVNKVWREASFPDDPVVKSNLRGWLSFATRGPNTRTTQLFVNFNDRNKQLDASGFSPFGRVVEGMDVVDKLYDKYGEGPPRGRGPDQMKIQSQGNEYLESNFKDLDYVKTARIVEAPKKADEPKK